MHDAASSQRYARSEGGSVTTDAPVIRLHRLSDADTCDTFIYDAYDANDADACDADACDADTCYVLYHYLQCVR